MPNETDIKQPLRNPWLDRMQMGDQHVKVSLRCAQCNEPVQTGIPHTCKQKENQNA